jgi:hypothetical protein
MLQVTDDLIRSVVQDVLKNMTGKPIASPTPTASGSWGVFDNVNDAVAAANKAQQQLDKLGLDGRKRRPIAFARSSSRKQRCSASKRWKKPRSAD